MVEDTVLNVSPIARKETIEDTEVCANPPSTYKNIEECTHELVQIPDEFNLKDSDLVIDANNGISGNRLVAKKR